MKDKKIFGIGAVVLMVLMAFAPAISGTQLDDLTGENVESSMGEDYDLMVLFPRCEYIRNDLLGHSIYEIDWVVASNSNLEETLDLYVKVGDEVIDTISVHFPSVPQGQCNGDSGTYNIKIKDEKELEFAGNEIALEIDRQDADLSNNVDYQMAKFWSESKDYEPSLAHLLKASPIDAWIKKEDVFQFQDENNTVVKIPVYRGLYKNIILPVLIGSDRLGWVGDFAQLVFIDLGIALCKFLYEFLEVCIDIAFVCGEISAAIAIIGGYFTSQAVPGAGVDWVLLGAFITDLWILTKHIEKLLKDLDALPIDPEDPLRQDLATAAEDCVELLYSRPWLDDVTIEGKFDRCLSGEKVTLSCRDIEDMEVPGGSGKRTIEPFNVSTEFDWKNYRDGLFFRRCQVSIQGDKHPDQLSQTPKLLSYCAPRGRLRVYGSFKKTRSKDSPSFINDLIYRFPVFAKLLKIFNTQQIGC